MVPSSVFHRDFPEHNVYTTPVFFSSDWLNEYWDTLEVDDYRFVYMGPKGSWYNKTFHYRVYNGYSLKSVSNMYFLYFSFCYRTPFHADVFRSYSWSANICGRKKWLLYPPGQEEFLRDSHGNLAYDITTPMLQDKGQFPHSEACQPLEIIQEAGEIILVLCGWHHQVYNLLSAAVWMWCKSLFTNHCQLSTYKLIWLILNCNNPIFVS